MAWLGWVDGEQWEDDARADMRNPNWTTDELILALDFYRRHPDGRYGKTSPEILELAGEISEVARAAGVSDAGGLRNVSSVYMKLMNFRSHDPAVRARGRRGLERSGRLDGELWSRYVDRPKSLRRDAKAIKLQIRGVVEGRNRRGVPEDPDVAEADEGKLLTRAHLSRERSRSLVRKKKESFRKQHGRVYCEACGFDFAQVYGSRGNDYIECHHTIPVSRLRPGDRTSLRDLILLCANCHRMIHAKAPWLTLEELRAVLASA